MTNRRSTSRKQIAVWGWGRHAKKRIVPAVLSCKSFELAAIISRGAVRPEHRNIEGRDLCFCSPGDVLTNPEIDTVYVATPTGLHHEHCMAALDAGKHVLCEKSLTVSLAHTRELLAVARRKNLFLAEAFGYLFHPQFQELRLLVSQGLLGEILTVTCEFGVPLEEPGFRRTAALGGGAFLDMGCYHLSILRELFNKEPEVLSARLEFPSNGAAHGDATGGAATDEGGWALTRLEPSAHAFLSWGYGRSYRNHLMIQGDKGGLAVDKVFSKPDDYDSTIQTWDKSGSRKDIFTGSARSFVNMLNDFAQGMDQPVYRERYLLAAERQALAMHRIRAATGAG